MQEFQRDDEVIKRIYTGSEREMFKQMNHDQAVMRERGYEMTKRVKVGRNAPCPCGSRLKFKKCCLSRLNANT